MPRNGLLDTAVSEDVLRMHTRVGCLSSPVRMHECVWPSYSRPHVRCVDRKRDGSRTTFTTAGPAEPSSSTMPRGQTRFQRSASMTAINVHADVIARVVGGAMRK